MTKWKFSRVSDDGCFHEVDNVPLYAQRFDEVLSFHDPGLAAVRIGNRAWHIDETGQRPYPAEFTRAFGFYEGRAAVRLGDQWFHILSNGAALTRERFSWCGNFQGGRCAIRRIDGRYQHLDIHGVPVCDESWRYAGDFRDGAAVVQDDDGFSSHIDSKGRVLHGIWFYDLDVFHKGFARARDERGWFHIRRNGAPAYTRRFAMIEAFYNGQARVECEDGSLEVIDESGKTILVLRSGGIR